MQKPAIIPFPSDASLEPWPDSPVSETASGSRQRSGRLWLNDRDRGVLAGLWQAEAHATPWLDYPTHELVLMVEGEAALATADDTLMLRPGDCAVIPKGLRCRWSQAGRVRKYFVLFDDKAGSPNTAPRRAIKVDPQAKLAPSTPPAAEMLHSPVPSQWAHEFFEDTTGQFTVGVWETTAYHRKLIDFPRHELMHLLEGSVTFTDGQGGTRTFTAGDTFFVPLGTPNTWKSEGRLRKIYCIFQPARK